MATPSRARTTTPTTPRPRTAAQLAATAARLCKAYQCDSREFDDCFEMGNGAEVVTEYIKLLEQDDQLQVATANNEWYINIAKWRETAARVTAERQAARLSTPLFPVSPVQ